MAEDRLFEVVLPRRVQQQPTPNVVGGGDCGACVLGGALGMTVEQIYELKGEQLPIDHWEMSRLLRVAESKGLADRIIDEAVQFKPLDMGGGHTPFGTPGWFQADQWHAHVQMAIDAGYYGLAQIDHDRKGLEGSGTNHWVLICGARTGITWTYKDHGGTLGVVGSGTNIIDVLVSCSARSSGMKDEWVDATQFLKFRGGYNLLFVRPVKQ